MVIIEQSYRLLEIYTKLLNHDTVNTAMLAEEFKVDRRTIQRDISNIKHYFYEKSLINELDYEIKFNFNANSYFIKNKTDLSLNNLETVSYEMTHQTHKLLKQTYRTQVVSQDSHHVKVEIKLSPIDAINLCFQHRKSLRLIAPESLYAQFVTELIKLEMIYLKNKI
ncbi:HTH domain-containing protein [Staphylococcus pettenkoferi]|uniref:HTH domain-containing protein n=1 Tax=Staphylococcus pettenkoferi TaxID=170573 RepID=UPI0011A15BA3|nr:HTH domain-containing protein [Staphylococcus pettenkoferi]